MTVHLPVRMKHLGFRWTDFHEISHSKYFQNFVQKIQVSLKSDNFTRIPVHIYEDISLCRRILLRMKNDLDKLVEKTKQAFYVQ